MGYVQVNISLGEAEITSSGSDRMIVVCVRLNTSWNFDCVAGCMTEDHSFRDHRIRCEELPSGAWQYTIGHSIQGEKFYASAADALSDAVDLIIVLDSRDCLSAEEFRGLVTAMDASLVEGRDSYTSK
jgi:hypothetical protein